MKQSYNIPRSIERGKVANNAALVSLNRIDTNLKSLAENAAKLQQIVKEYSKDDNQKRLTLTK